ncbi:MAG: glycosyltransferase family 4 protein [Kiritimatiellia bacterium]
MKATAAAYRDRVQTVWRNVQANRRLRPADFVNGYKMVQPLRSLGNPSVSFDMAQLALEMFTRLRIQYEPQQATRPPVAPMPTRRAPGERGLRVGLFVDAPDHLSGVCLTIGEWQDQARRHGCSLTVHTCAPAPDEGGFVSFRPMGSVRLDAYSGLTVHVPRMEEIASYAENMDFDVIHVSTPGPMGLLGLLAARQRGLPVCGTYHTDFPRYAGELTGDPALEQVGWQFMRWFYGQLDRVAAPTESIRRELIAHGFDAERVQVVGRGVDTTLFEPSRRDEARRTEQGHNKSLQLLYVGRLSREKNLETLASAFKRLLPTRPDISLTLVGEGPFRTELERLLAGTPVTFAGTLKGEALARAYASADLFVFPSKTDTFGRVVLEAQASGLPVVVSDQGGPKDAMLDGITGVVVDALDEQRLAAAIDALTDDPARMAAFSIAAREFAGERTHASSFKAFWHLHHTIHVQPQHQVTP